MRRRKLTCPPCFGGIPSTQAGQTAKGYLGTACSGYRGSRCYVLVPSAGDGRATEQTWRAKPPRLVSISGAAEWCRAVRHAEVARQAQSRCRCWPPTLVAVVAYEGHGAKLASSKPWGAMLTCVKPKGSQCGECRGWCYRKKPVPSDCRASSVSDLGIWKASKARRRHRTARHDRSFLCSPSVLSSSNGRDRAACYRF